MFILNIPATIGGIIVTNGNAINESEAAPIASASTTDIWAIDGNTVHITGTTTIDDFAGPPNVGAWRRLIFDDVLTLTNGAGIQLPGGADIITATDDFAFVYGETASSCKVLYFKADGTAVVAAAPAGGGGVFTGSFESAPQTILALGELTLPHGLPSTPTLFQAFLKNVNAILGYSVGDITPIGISATTDANRGLSIIADATNINVKLAAPDNNFTVLNRATGIPSAIERVDWKLIIRAYSE